MSDKKHVYCFKQITYLMWWR